MSKLIKQLLTKRNTALLAGILTVLFASSLWYLMGEVCSSVINVSCRGTNDFVEKSTNVTLWGPFILLVSFITYKIRDEVFDAWIRFAMWWVPLSVFVVIVSPDNDATLMAPTTREIFSMLSLGLFVLISLVIIVTKWIKVRKK